MDLNSDGLIINTHGWIKGVGAQLVQGVIDLIQPDIMIHLGTGVEELYCSDSLLNKVIVLDGYSKTSGKNALDARTSKLHQYFAPRLQVLCLKYLYLNCRN